MGDVESENAVVAWQRGRQERVDRILGLNRHIDKRRMPGVNGEGENKRFDLEWFYPVEIKRMVEEWLRRDKLPMVSFTIFKSNRTSIYLTCYFLPVRQPCIYSSTRWEHL